MSSASCTMRRRPTVLAHDLEGAARDASRVEQVVHEVGPELHVAADHFERLQQPGSRSSRRLSRCTVETNGVSGVRSSCDTTARSGAAVPPTRRPRSPTDSSPRVRSGSPRRRGRSRTPGPWPASRSRGRLAEQDGDRGGLLAGRAARHPDPHRVHGRLAFEEGGQLGLERLAALRVAEEVGDADQPVLQQGRRFARPRGHAGQVGLQLVHRTCMRIAMRSRMVARLS